MPNFIRHRPGGRIWVRRSFILHCRIFSLTVAFQFKLTKFVSRQFPKQLTLSTSTIKDKFILQKIPMHVGTTCSGLSITYRYYLRLDIINCTYI
ncbi:hypothetical protein T4D_8749 [Trichinella pseudospiralis]|uniref:Uncharacterized protein n=1 Tax=Trichinella pseudospiralis TaxID=6337 RepID=A0A0V1FIA7_TRIPS|nr:hypothetical protein T4D_8749 [Trichinella pseudospiralis]